ncbi:PASTA domain-containing protein [Bailinhaonella thermotolerans]|nr:PASTA domain-containing protein [Bailinhaonella thermotolerans]
MSDLENRLRRLTRRLPHATASARPGRGPYGTAIHPGDRVAGPAGAADGLPRVARRAKGCLVSFLAALGVLALIVVLAVACGSSDPEATSTAPAKRVPKVTGKRLAEAMEILTAAGFRDIKPRDAAGESRIIVNQTNWVVTEQEPAAGTRRKIDLPITLRVRKPSDGATNRPVVKGVIPKVTCLDLQTAQNRLQEAGYTNLVSKDGTGKDRQQVIDRNWIVTAQSPKPGTTPAKDKQITLTAIKFGEKTKRCKT